MLLVERGSERLHGAGENRDRRLAGDKNGKEMKQVSDKYRVVEHVKLPMRVTAVRRKTRRRGR